MRSRLTITTFLIAAACAANALADPPERVARVSVLSGNVSFRPATSDEWSPATMNYPLTVGDEVWTDRSSRLELEMGATAVDFDALTSASVLNLDHHVVQLRLLQGTAVARVRELAPDESLEVDTPNSAITLLRPGLYRIWVSPNGESTTVTVQRGDVEVASGPSAFPVHADQSAEIDGVEGPTHSLVALAPPDEFDQWALARDQREDTTTGVRYMPRTMVGYEDLDGFGAWQVTAAYGPVWVPRVQRGWAPYRFGHWVWREPWGWTWIDDAAWGFAPFHYGRWAVVNSGWVWVPGAVVARPVYAPALVAFVGGAGWQVGVATAPVGWFPLGPREVFVPAYSVSPAYVTALNRPHGVTTVVNVNVTNTTYVNRAVPGAVTVVSRETFVQARPVATAVVPVSPQTLGAAVIVGHAAPREIVPVAVPPVRAAAVPPPAIATRAVVVRTPPPAAVVQVPTRRLTATAPATVPARAAPATVPPASQGAPVAVRPAPAPHANPQNVAAEMAARHARERAEIDARHASERADLQARHAAEAKTSDANAHAQANLHTRQAHEQAALDARHKREQEQLQKRQDAERGRKQQ
ncbi:MAG TPA: DUF6600 domain-containing protein [Vicinamibacterales bacterium]